MSEPQLTQPPGALAREARASVDSMERLLAAGQRAWDELGHAPAWDDLSGALTDCHFARLRLERELQNFLDAQTYPKPRERLTRALGLAESFDLDLASLPKGARDVAAEIAALLRAALEELYGLRLDARVRIELDGRLEEERVLWSCESVAAALRHFGTQAAEHEQEQVVQALRTLADVVFHELELVPDARAEGHYLVEAQALEGAVAAAELAAASRNEWWAARALDLLLRTLRALALELEVSALARGAGSR